MNFDKQYTLIKSTTVKRKSYYRDWWLIAPRNRIRANTDDYDVDGIDNGYYLEMRCPDRMKRWINEYDWKHDIKNVVQVYDLIDCPNNAFENKKYRMITMEEYTKMKV